MTTVNKTLLAGVGAFLGAVASWAFLLVAFELIPWTGAGLAVSFLVVALSALAIARRSHLRPVATGLIIGAAAETLFFWWLFAEFSRGLDRI